MARWFFLLVQLTTLLSTVSANAGVVGGARTAHYALIPGATDVWTFTFKGGEQATVWVHGDNTTDLDCRLLDHTGRLIDVNVDPTYSTCIFKFRPERMENYTVEVFGGNPKNLVKVEMYDIETN